MQDAPPHENVRRGQRIIEEVARVEAQPVVETVRLDVPLEDRTNGWKIKPAAREVVVGQRNLDRQPTLRRPDVHEGLVPIPRELAHDRHRRSHADARHGLEEAFETARIGVKGSEKVLPPFRLVLRLAGAQCLGERTPEWVQSGVGHLE